MEPKDQLKFKCAELQQKLEANEPGYKSLLKEIHDQIRQVPDLAYMLDDSEIAIVVAGLQKFTGVSIAVAKSTEKITKKQASKLTADDV